MRHLHSAVADPHLAFGGAVKLGGAKNVFTCLNAKGCLRQSLCVTHKRLSFLGEKVAILLAELCYFSGNKQSLKALYIMNLKKFGTGPKQWASFLTRYTDLVYLQNVFKRYKSMLRASVCH